MQRGQGRSRGSPSVLVRPHTGQCQPAARTSAASTVETRAVREAHLDADPPQLDRQPAPGGAPADAHRAVEGLDAAEREHAVLLDRDGVADGDAEREPRLLEALPPGDPDRARVPAHAQPRGILEDRVLPPGGRGAAVLALAELGVGALGEQLERLAHEIARGVDRAHRLAALLALGVGRAVGVVLARCAAVGVAELTVVDRLVERQSQAAQGVGERSAHVGGMGVARGGCPQGDMPAARGASGSGRIML